MKYKVLKEAALRELNEEDAYSRIQGIYQDLDDDTKNEVQKLISNFIDGIYGLYSSDDNPDGMPSYLVVSYARAMVDRALKDCENSVTSYC